MNKAFLPAAIATTLLLTACGGESNNSSNTNPNVLSPGAEQTQGKRLVMNIDLAQLQSSGLTADKVVVTISKGEFTKTLEISHENYAATAEFSDLVVGDYQIEVDVFDGETLVAEGTASATVSANQVATTDLRLELKAGGLVVEVCVPGLAPESVLSNTESFNVSKAVALEGLGVGFIGELAAGDAEYTYASDFAYSALQLNDEISVDVSVDQQWELIDDIKYSVSDHNMLKMTSAGNEILELSGCNEKIEMHNISVFDPNSSNGPGVELKFPMTVQGYDWVLADGEPIEEPFGDGELAEPRPISELTLTLRFVSTGSDVLANPYDSVFDSGDIAALFDRELFDRELYVEITGFERHLVEMDTGTGILVVAAPGRLEAALPVE